MGCFLFDDYAFCCHVAKLLESYCNHRIAEIGSLDPQSFPLDRWSVAVYACSAGFSSVALKSAVR
jgi:hypothetical protein